MATGENGDLAIQVAELRSEMRVEIRHVQENIAEIKTDLRDFKKSTEDRFNRLEARFDRFRAELGAELRTQLRAELRAEIREQIASVKLWTFGMYVAFASTLLYVVAKSAKWL